MQRTRKHQSKKEKFFANAQPDVTLVRVASSELEDEPLISVRGAPHLINALIENGDTYVEHAVKLLQNINDQLGNNKVVSICSLCAKKIGIKRCSQCPSTTSIRYCSRRCQVAAWPEHKTCCGGRTIINVD
jgi:hypothetical protein